MTRRKRCARPRRSRWVILGIASALAFHFLLEHRRIANAPALAPAVAPEDCQCPCEEQGKYLDGRIYDEDWAVDLCRTLSERYPCTPPYCGTRTVRLLAGRRGWGRVSMHVPAGDPGMGFVYCPSNGRCRLVYSGTMFAEDVEWIRANPSARHLPGPYGYQIPREVWPSEWRDAQSTGPGEGT
jgi:hypothetical protein